MKLRTSNVSADERGLSPTIGFVLLISIVFISAVAVVGAGSITIMESQGMAENSAADQGMTAFESKASMVAYEGSTRQTVKLPNTGMDSVKVVEEGRMTVTLQNESGVVEAKLLNDTLRSLVYEKQSGYEVAYQGGGVWSQRNGNVNNTQMLTTPDFSYSDNTATIPITTLSADSDIESTGGEVAVTSNNSEKLFPDADANLRNPVMAGNVLIVDIQSPYYRAWGDYFEERLDMDASYDHSENEVTVAFTGRTETEPKVTRGIQSVGADKEMEIKGSGAGNTFLDSYNSTIGPYSISQSDNGTIASRTGINSQGRVDFFGNVVTEGNLVLGGNSYVHGDAKVNGNVIKNGAGSGVEGEITNGADLEAVPAIDGVIAHMNSVIKNTNNNNDTSAISSTTPPELDTSSDPVLTAGDYYVDELYVPNGETLTLDVSSGDIRIVSNGEITVNGELDVVGNFGNDHRAEIYTRSKGITFDGGIASTDGQDSTGLWLFGPQGTVVDMVGGSSVTAAIYTPGTEESPGKLHIEGHSNLYGGVVGGETSVQSQSKVHYDSALQSEVAFEEKTYVENVVATEITYFHVTHNTVEVSG